MLPVGDPTCFEVIDARAFGQATWIQVDTEKVEFFRKWNRK